MDETPRKIQNLLNMIIENSDLTTITEREIRKLELKNAHIIAIGKAAVSMAQGALNALKKVEGGIIVVPEYISGKINGVEVIRSTHPLPSEKSLKAADAILEYARSLDEKEHVLVLVSGGGSALVEKPLPPMSIEDTIALNRLLLNSGMSILEINTIRKHVSQIKGGKLAQALRPAKTTGLYASDVPGDRLDLIASGPTVPDPTTYNNALRILENYHILGIIPENARIVLEKGARGEIPETPKPGDPIFRNVENKLIAYNLQVLEHLKKTLQTEGYNTIILTSRITGESREVAKALASIALEICQRGVPLEPPAAVIVGGETSVSVKGSGKGGRNMELSLWFAKELDYWLGPNVKEGIISILSVDTDGIDGVTDAAGAYGYNGLYYHARRKGVDYDRYLENNDSYSLAEKLGVLVKTGPTGSNLNSISVILVEDKCD